ncbi:MFS transporter [Kribbella sp. NPDC050470]|uniref:MFS transporter n=1 Tax=unclassified Kribbella TaxID=2644121 RepID=UPI0037AE347D
MKTSSRKPLVGAQVGLYVDMFDVYLPIVALAPAAAYFAPDDISTSAQRILTAVVFAATLLGRPLGALVFGRLSDKSGRKRTTLTSLIGFGLTTLAIAALPGYQQAGLFAIIALILLRFTDGIFLGGQYTAAAPLALEHAPARKRGLYGAIIMTGFPAAYCSIALITVVLLKLIPAGGLGTPYVTWGWRIPFVIGGLLALAWALWYHRNVEESPVWKNRKNEGHHPLRDLFQGPNLRGFLQVFTLMSGVWLAFNMVGAVLPGVLRTRLPVGTVTLILVVAYAVLIVTYLLSGSLAQRIGRRPFFLLQGATTTVIAPVLFWSIARGKVSGAVAIGLVTVALVVVVVSTFAVVTTYIIERFHTGIRSSGYGLGYTTAVIVPAFYAFYQEGLATVMPYELTPLVFLAAGGLLIGLGAYVGPETRDVDLGAPAAKADADLLSGSMVGLPLSGRPLSLEGEARARDH